MASSKGTTIQLNTAQSGRRLAPTAGDSYGFGKPADSNFSGKRSAFRLTLLVAIAIFCSEMLDMVILYNLGIASMWLEALADSLILLVFLAPVLYYLLFKPLVGLVRRQKAAEFHQMAYQRILRISNTSPDLDNLLQRYAEELKLLTDCEIITIRVIDWLGHVKFQSARAPECLRTQASPKCLASKLQAGFCIQIMKELDDKLTEYKTEMGSLYCPQIPRMLAGLHKDKVQEIVKVCPLDRLETLALIPMAEKDVRLGFIQIADTRPDALAPAVIDIVEKSSLQVAAAIQRMRAEDGLRQTKAWLEARVKERTAMLTEANIKLNEEIAQQKRLNDAIEGYKRKLQCLSKQVLEEEQQGRKQVATDLHDRIGHNLALIKIRLGMLARKIAPHEASKIISQILGVLNQTITDTRTLTFELSPPILYEIGLQSALEWLVQQMKAHHDLDVELVSRGGEGNLNDNQRFVLFRATRELLFNVIKHARADKAQVIIRSNNGQFLLDVEDNGIGFKKSVSNAASYESAAFGLFGIRERLGYLGGKLKIANRKAGGARVTLQIPIEMEAKPSMGPRSRRGADCNRRNT